MPEYHTQPLSKHALIRPSDSAVYTIQFESPNPITADTFDAAVAGTRAVNVWGEITYRDVFGDKHRLGFGIEMWINRGAAGGWHSFPIDRAGYNFEETIAPALAGAPRSGEGF